MGCAGTFYFFLVVGTSGGAPARSGLSLLPTEACFRGAVSCTRAGPLRGSTGVGSQVRSPCCVRRCGGGPPLRGPSASHSQTSPPPASEPHARPHPGHLSVIPASPPTDNILMGPTGMLAFTCVLKCPCFVCQCFNGHQCKGGGPPGVSVFRQLSALKTLLCVCVAHHAWLLGSPAECLTA